MRDSGRSEREAESGAADPGNGAQQERGGSHHAGSVRGSRDAWGMSATRTSIRSIEDW